MQLGDKAAVALSDLLVASDALRAALDAAENAIARALYSQTVDTLAQLLRVSRECTEAGAESVARSLHELARGLAADARIDMAALLNIAHS